MPDEPTTTLASDAEIEAALAEAQAHVARIPSLDDGGQRAVVPVQAEIGRRPAARAQPMPVTAPVVVVAAPVNEPPLPIQPPSTALPARCGRLHRLVSRLLGLLRPHRTPLIPAPTPLPTFGAAPAAYQALPDAPRPPLTAGRIIYRAIDAVLAAVNWPFRWVGPEARQLAGLLATVTIVVSLLAAHFLPVLSPPRDAISELHRRVLQAQQGPTPAPATAAPVQQSP